MNPTSKDLKWLKLTEEGAKLFSTCGKRQYFAIVLDNKGRCVGTGYNGGPSGARHCVDGGCQRLIDKSPPGSNYDNCIAIHAEANALLHASYSNGGTLYVNGPPCFQCMKMIANSGVKRVVHSASGDYADYPRIKSIATTWGLDIIEVKGN